MARAFEHANTTEAFRRALTECRDHPEFVSSPRGRQTREVLNYSFTVADPSQDPIVTADAHRNATIAAYTHAEFSLHARGERSVEAFARRAPFWRELGNADGTINSAYGWKVWFEPSTADGRTQWQWARHRLEQDPDTRQAYILINTPATQREGVKDQVCTFAGQFLLRERRLHFSVVMRSNDVVRGLCYDMPWFCSLQIRMAHELGVFVGSYHHLAHSMHLYSDDLMLVNNMVGNVYAPQTNAAVQPVAQDKGRPALYVAGVSLESG